MVDDDRIFAVLDEDVDHLPLIGQTCGVNILLASFLSKLRDGKLSESTILVSLRVR